MTDLTALGHLDQYHYGGIQATSEHRLCSTGETIRHVDLQLLTLAKAIGRTKVPEILEQP